MFDGEMVSGLVLVGVIAIAALTDSIRTRKQIECMERRMKLEMIKKEHTRRENERRTLRICNDFAEECKQRKEPIRKAVGLFSDETAQEIIRNA